MPDLSPSGIIRALAVRLSINRSFKASTGRLAVGLIWGLLTALCLYAVWRGFAGDGLYLKGTRINWAGAPTPFVLLVGASIVGAVIVSLACIGAFLLDFERPRRRKRHSRG